MTENRVDLRAFQCPEDGELLRGRKDFSCDTQIASRCYKKGYLCFLSFSARTNAKKKEVFFMKKKMLSQEKIFKLCCLGVLIAMQIVLARFAVIPVGDMMRFSTSFIPVVIGARLFGIAGGMAVYGIGDLVGAIAFPTGGAFFPGYTVTAVIVGLIFGLFLRPTKNEETALQRNIKIVLSVLSTQLVGSFLLNSFWRSFQTGTPYGAVLLTRLPQCLVSVVVQTLFMVLFLEKICKVISRNKQ